MAGHVVLKVVIFVLRNSFLKPMEYFQDPLHDNC